MQVVFIWTCFERDFEACKDPSSSFAGRERTLPFYYGFIHDLTQVCDLLAVVIALSFINFIVSLIWFAWTLWLARRVARTMSGGWTRGGVLKFVGMREMTLLREGQAVSGGKVYSMNELRRGS
jgi:hypothetical protein